MKNATDIWILIMLLGFGLQLNADQPATSTNSSWWSLAKDRIARAVQVDRDYCVKYLKDNPEPAHELLKESQNEPTEVSDFSEPPVHHNYYVSQGESSNWDDWAVTMRINGEFRTLAVSRDNVIVHNDAINWRLLKEYIESVYRHVVILRRPLAQESNRDISDIVFILRIKIELDKRIQEADLYLFNDGAIRANKAWLEWRANGFSRLTDDIRERFHKIVEWVGTKRRNEGL